jgi:hypothetical protein
LERSYSQEPFSRSDDPKIPNLFQIQNEGENEYVLLLWIEEIANIEEILDF